MTHLVFISDISMELLELFETLLSELHDLSTERLRLGGARELEGSGAAAGDSLGE